MKQTKGIVVFVLGILMAAPALATRDQKMADYFSSRLSEVSDGLSHHDFCGRLDLGPMALTDLNVDLTPSVSFGVNSVLNLTVAAEIDLIFVPPADGL